MKTCEAPAATVTGPAGVGPVARLTIVAPGPTARVIGDTLTASTCPVFVTVWGDAKRIPDEVTEQG